MACNGCTKQFGFWTSEVGCPNCKFSFCKNCLKYNIHVPKLNAKKYVCLKCFDTIKRQGAATEAPKKQNVLQILQDAPQNLPDIPVLQPKPAAIASNSCDPDAELRARLDALKDAPIEVTSNDTDLAKRLASLKGVEHKEYDHKSYINTVDRRTDQEKTDDLVKQFMEETEIDAKKVDPVSDIERRLALLRGEPSGEADAKDKELAKQLDSEPEEDDETVAKKLMKRYIDEAKIEGPLDPAEKEFLDSLPPPTADTEELPWCTICNEDAAIRCLGCDGELFCGRCFRECHDDEEYREHETKAFKKPKAKEELEN